MKRALRAVSILSVVAVTQCLAQSHRARSDGGMWFGKDVWARFTDDTFVRQPTWVQIVTSEPPLSAAAACKKATAHVATARADQLTYTVKDVSLRRFFDTDNWYYRVHFEAVVPSGDRSWQMTEPYQSLLASGQYPPNTNVPPRLDVFLLLSGDVVALEEM
jgi:hypothetical protein